MRRASHNERVSLLGSGETLAGIFTRPSSSELISDDRVDGRKVEVSVAGSSTLRLSYFGVITLAK